MSAERQVMQDYIDALVKRADFTSYFAEDVVATFEGTDQRADGRPAAGELIRYVHEIAFDARPEVKNMLALTPANSPESSPPTAPCESLTRLSTTCAMTGSARCGSTFL